MLVNLTLPMNADATMEAPATNEWGNGEASNDHELGIWGEQLDEGKRYVDLLLISWGRVLLAERAEAHAYGTFYDYGMLAGMNGQYILFARV